VRGSVLSLVIINLNTGIRSLIPGSEERRKLRHDDGYQLTYIITERPSISIRE
jgi:hypothetical protein